MKVSQDSGTLMVSDIEALDASTAGAFQAGIAAALVEPVGQIEVDLSRTAVMDCAGLGALVALRNSARQRDAAAAVRLIHPQTAVRRLLQLTCLEGTFEAAGRWKLGDVGWKMEDRRRKTEDPN